jgi:hypothetical protein
MRLPLPYFPRLFSSSPPRSSLAVCAPAAFALPARLHPALPEPFLGALPLPQLPGGFRKTSFLHAPAPC